MPLETTIVNSKGDGKIILNDQEVAYSNALETQIKNTTGFDLPVTTLTAISKRITEQKYFTITPSQYIPVRVGQNAWASQILTYQTGSTGGNFANGIINMGENKARLDNSDALIQTVVNPVRTWAGEINYTIPELAFAARAGNFQIVEAKERARKTRWDLGIQAIAFIGDATQGLTGLLNQTTVNVNTTVITQFISSMSAAQFATFVATVLGAYRVNNLYTAFPDTFVIPELDYDGLMTPVSATYPNVSMYDYLLNAFRQITGNPNFQILPNRYSDNTGNPAGTHIYALYNRDEGSLVMDLPVPYTTTAQNTINGFQWTNVAYGQFTGVQALRPLEMLYFTF